MTHQKLAHSHVHVVCKLNLTGKSIYGHSTELVIYIALGAFIHLVLTFRTAFTMLSETMGQLITSENEKNPGRTIAEQVASLNQKYEMQEDLTCWIQ